MIVTTTIAKREKIQTCNDLYLRSVCDQNLVTELLVIDLRCHGPNCQNFDWDHCGKTFRPLPQKFLESSFLHHLGLHTRPNLHQTRLHNRPKGHKDGLLLYIPKIKGDRLSNSVKYLKSMIFMTYYVSNFLAQ